MQYTNLGRSGLRVSRLCLGTMNFGPYTSEADAHSIMDFAHEHGLNFFDTANNYGRTPGQVGNDANSGAGTTEEIIGRWFAAGGGRRERTVLATKAYSPMSDLPNDGKLSALNIRRSLDASLRRLQTDYVDLFQFHHIDRSTPWDEIWQAIDVAISQGKVLYVGSSNFAGWHLAQAQASAERAGLIGLQSEQSLYNLIIRDIELEVIPAALNYGIGILPWSPIEGGLLGGVVQREADSARRNADRNQQRLEQFRPQLTAYEKLCAELGHHPALVALAWLLHQPAVTAPITGPRTVDQLATSLQALEIQLDPESLTHLDTIFPGYRTAPENYSW